jgi:hypothetical protein
MKKFKDYLREQKIASDETTLSPDFLEKKEKRDLQIETKIEKLSKEVKKEAESHMNENYDVYLDMPSTKKFKATVKVINKMGKEEHFPIGTDDNIRKAAHETVKGLTDKGYKLKDVEYHFD